jgi:hypothetical protein
MKSLELLPLCCCCEHVLRTSSQAKLHMQKQLRQPSSCCSNSSHISHYFPSICHFQLLQFRASPGLMSTRAVFPARRCWWLARTPNFTRATNEAHQDTQMVQHYRDEAQKLGAGCKCTAPKGALQGTYNPRQRDNGASKPRRNNNDTVSRCVSRSGTDYLSSTVPARGPQFRIVSRVSDARAHTHVKGSQTYCFLSKQAIPGMCESSRTGISRASCSSVGSRRTSCKPTQCSWRENR